MSQSFSAWESTSMTYDGGVRLAQNDCEKNVGENDDLFKA